MNPLIVALYSAFMFAVHSPETANPQNTGKSDPGISPENAYYLQLKNEEFLQTMIPREQFLLGLVESVNYEISKRKMEGVAPSELGVQDVVSPEEKLMDDLALELELIEGLLGEIGKLERKAKRQVDVEALEILDALKNRVRRLLSGDTSDLSEEAPLEVEAGGEDQEIPILEDEVALDEETRKLEIFEEVKYNRILDYKVKLTKYLYLRLKLLQAANPMQARRMFQMYYRQALINYSAGDFMLARLQLRDILNTYKIYDDLDDVLYYASEAAYGLNFFDEAMEGYDQLLNRYPDSSFRNQALTKLLYIHYILGDYGRLQAYYDALLYRKDLVDQENRTTVSYIVGYAYFRAGRYEDALSALGNADPQAVYYYPSLYLSGACHSNLGRNDAALAIYQQLSTEIDSKSRDPLLIQIRNNAHLKLGLLYYEQGDDQRAIQVLDRVDVGYDHYDLSLLGKAWSAYRSGRPGEALENVEGVLQSGLVSNYAFEAQVLAASSMELLGQKEEAIEELKNVYQVHSKAQQLPLPGKGIESRSQAMETGAGEGESNILAQMKDIRQFLAQSALRAARPLQVASQGEFSETAVVLNEKIRELDAMEAKARSSGNRALIEEIRQLRGDFLSTLEAHTDNMASLAVDPEMDPLLRRMGMVSYLKYGFQTLLQQTIREKEQTRIDIDEAEKRYKAFEASGEFQSGIQAEIQKDELEDYYGKLNQYEVWLRENFPQEVEVELDRWATFSGYGISNINFERIKDTERRIAEISETVDVLDRLFKIKRKNLENRIQNLLTDVDKIETQMQEEAEKKDGAERDRYFKTNYFDKQQKEAKVGPVDLKNKGTKEKK